MLLGVVRLILLLLLPAIQPHPRLVIVMSATIMYSVHLLIGMVTHVFTITVVVIMLKVGLVITILSLQAMDGQVHGVQEHVINVLSVVTLDMC